MSEDSIASGLLTKLERLLPAPFRRQRPRVAVVRLSGVIGLASPLRPGLSLNGVAGALERAFALPDVAGIAIVINSPGGSAVQSRLIFQRIRALATEKNLPVTVFVEDVAASGGYMIACAGDEIFVDPASIVGSIGVISAGFGLDRVIERLGIDRRLQTAGERKGMLDPFQPEKPEDVKRLRAILKELHDVFIEIVKERRGPRLTGAERMLFSGEFWTGRKALELGLVDGIGDVRSILRERHGEALELVLIPTERKGLLRRLAGQGQSASEMAPATLPAQLIGALEAHGLWRRFGL